MIDLFVCQANKSHAAATKKVQNYEEDGEPSGKEEEIDQEKEAEDAEPEPEEKDEAAEDDAADVKPKPRKAVPTKSTPLKPKAAPTTKTPVKPAGSRTFVLQ